MREKRITETSHDVTYHQVKGVKGLRTFLFVGKSCGFELFGDAGTITITVMYVVASNKTPLNRGTAATPLLCLPHEKVSNPLHPFFVVGHFLAIFHSF